MPGEIATYHLAQHEIRPSFFIVERQIEQSAIFGLPGLVQIEISEKRTRFFEHQIQLIT